MRAIPLSVPASGRPGFTRLDASTTGVAFTNLLRGDLALTNAIAHNGSGVALADVDGDGRVDIYLSGLQNPNRLFRNLGDWRFAPIESGAAECADQLSTAAVFADVDGDGDPDLLVNGIGTGTRLFLNDGQGRFAEMRDSGLSRTASAMSMALADIDGDGDLDLYCAHYIDVMLLADPTTRITTAMRDGRTVITHVNGQPADRPPWRDRFTVDPDGSVRELPEVDGLYRNDGHGHFTPIQFEPGVFMDEAGRAIPPFRYWGLSAMFRDVNGDGAPDLYVCNDNASPDQLWINTGRGTFRLIDPPALRHGSRASMGVDFADLNRDGLEDFLVVDMLARAHGKRMTQLVRTHPDPTLRERSGERPLFNRNTLFLGRADGTFAETALFAGIAATDWSWCPAFLDVDLDGFEDLLVTCGFEQDVMDQDSTDRLGTRKWTPDLVRRYRQFHPAARSRNAAFRNRGDATFEPMDSAWGFDVEGVSQGMALADLDGDGDLDLVVNHLNAAVGLYRNNATAPRLAIELRGAAPNTRGIGARLRLTGGPVLQSQEMIAGGRYLSGDEPLRVFATGTPADGALQLEVRWRDGRISTVAGLQPNHRYVIDATAARPGPAPVTRTNPAPFFADATELLAGHAHVENDFDDWARQPLLPRRLSRAGPGLGWIDFNADGWEDLIVTGARDGKLTVLASGGGGPFRLLQGADRATADLGAVVGWADAEGTRKFVVAGSNFELADDQPGQLRFYSARAAAERQPAGRSTPGPLAVADLDGDGDLDLFVGGRVIPGRYPEPASSTLWLCNGTTLQPDAERSRPFGAVGLVTGATFTDLDGDGDPDLVLALEWGPIRVFRNQAGRFDDVTAALGLASHTGWWTSVAAGDFDGDGRMDLVAGNWGRNSAVEILHADRLGAFFGDWNGDNGVQIVEAWRDRSNWFPILDRTRLQTVLPDLKQRFPTHEAFGRATAAEILAPKQPAPILLEAAELESAVFLNRGDHFERVPLPPAAQLAPAMCVNVGDFDADGREDLFLSQNFLGTAAEVSRDDGGQGLWLRGRGDGRFDPLDAVSSGVRVDGEQRAAALGDFNHDGRVDLAVAQNNGPTRLFVNQSPRRGLRVTLEGPRGNPTGVGCRLRVIAADGQAGPCREVHAGSGSLSQDAPVPILGAVGTPTAVEVRWPDGKTERVPLTPEQLDIHVRHPAAASARAASGEGR